MNVEDIDFVGISELFKKISVTPEEAAENFRRYMSVLPSADELIKDTEK